MRSPDARDAAVVGVGLVTALGFGSDAVTAALSEGRRAAHPVGRVEEPHLRATVPADLESQAKFLNGSGQMAATAVAEAVAAARLAEAGYPEVARGLYLAQMDLTFADFLAYRPAFVAATEEFAHPVDAQALNTATLRRMNPFYLLETINNNAFSFLSAWHGLKGANTSLSGWSGPGLEVVGLAARAVRRGDAAAAVACAAARWTGAVVRREMETLGVLPAGGVPAEGAAAVVVEPLGAARARGAAPLALVLGTGAAFGPAEGGRRGAAPAAVRAAAEEALGEAGARPGDVVAVVAPSAADVPAGLGAASGAARVAWREHLGHVGAASDVADVALAVRALAGAALLRGPTGPPKSVLVLATGMEGQAEALLLARP